MQECLQQQGQGRYENMAAPASQLGDKPAATTARPSSDGSPFRRPVTPCTSPRPSGRRCSFRWWRSHNGLPIAFRAQVHGMFKEFKSPIIKFPSEITMPLMSLHGRSAAAPIPPIFQLALGHALLHAKQFLPRSFHRLFTLALFVLPAFVRIDHKHAQRFFVAGHFLHACSRWVSSFARRNSQRTSEPSVFLDGLQPFVQLGRCVVASVQPDNHVCRPSTSRGSPRSPCRDRRRRRSAQGKARLQIRNNLLHRRRVETVACPYVMRDRPTPHHHQANHHLHVLLLAIAAVTVLREVLRAGPFEIGAGDVEEHQVRLQTEQIAQAS